MTAPTSPATGKASVTSDWMAGRPLLLLALVALMFMAAAVVRAYKPDAAGVLVDRDYTSAVFSRDFYFRHADDIEPWRRDMARALRQKQPDLEPPVTEWLVAQLYHAAGREDLRFARALTSAFWLAGGLFLFGVIRRLSSTDAAVLGLGYYLFQPMSVLLSRSFQPDALMMLMFLAALYGVVRYHQQPGGRWLAFASLMTAATLVHRPLVLPTLVGAFLVPQISRHGFWKGMLHRDSVIFGLIGVVPSIAYYAYATFVAKHFGWKLSSSFRFHLWAHEEYWRRWWNLAVISTGLPFLLLAPAGAALLEKGLARSIVAGLALGYAFFCLMFTMHAHTHDYYHAQLIPIMALTAAQPFASLVRKCFAQRALWPRLLLLMAAVATAAWWARDINKGLHRAGFEPPTTAREIGRLVGHSERVVYLSRYYGLPLQYFGEFTGAYWPRPITYWLYRTEGERELSIAERLDALGFQPEYFVITYFGEFERNHQALARYLDRKCALKARSELYLVYERCLPPDEAE